MCFVSPKVKAHGCLQKTTVRKTAERNAQGFIDRYYCIARRYNCGNIAGIPELSLMEKILLGQYVFFSQLIKPNA